MEYIADVGLRKVMDTALVIEILRKEIKSNSLKGALSFPLNLDNARIFYPPNKKSQID